MCHPRSVSKGGAHLGLLEGVHHLLERGEKVAGPGPSEITSHCGVARVVGVGAREVGEVGPVDDAFAKVQKAGTGLGFAQDFVGLQQNVACAGLGEDMRLAGADVQDLDDMESARAADRLRYLAVRQSRHDIGEQSRQLARPAPAEVPALQGLLPI